MTTYTTNFNLEKYTSGDAANLNDQYNASMDIIDTNLYKVSTNANNALNTANNALNTANNANTVATTNKDNITAIDANLNALHANTVTDATNLYNIIQKTNSIKIATPEMYGAKGDATTDDTTAIQDAIDKNDTVIFTQKYLINNTIQITEDKNLYFIGGIIYANNTAFNTVATIKNHYHYVHIYNAKIINNNINGNYPAITTTGLKLYIVNSIIQDFKGGGIITHTKTIDNVVIKGNLTANNLTLIILNGFSSNYAINTKDTTDSRGSTLYIKDYRIAIGDNDGEWSNIHAYITHPEIFPTSLVISHSGGAIRVSNVYVDTMKTFYARDTTGDNYRLAATNITIFINTVVIELTPIILVRNKWK